MDDALRRAEAYRTAGADLLLLSPRTPEEIRHIGERLGGPLMYLCKPGGVAASGMSAADLHALGWRLLADRSEEHTSELQSLMRLSYAVFCLKKNNPAAVTTTVFTTDNIIRHTLQINQENQ